MKHTYCMDKLFKFNNRIFLFIKKIKNLQEQEKGKTKDSNQWIYLECKQISESKTKVAFTSYGSYQIIQYFFCFSWDFGIIAWDNLTAGNDTVIL